MTLTESITDEVRTQSSIEDCYKQFSSLSIPTHADPRFNIQEWRSFIHNCSSYQAKQLKQSYEFTDSQESILSGIQVYHGDLEELENAFSIVVENENGKDWITENCLDFLAEFGERFIFSPLIANWISNIYICDEETYINRVEYDSSGYYHPTEHWIAVKYDSGDPDSTYWSVENDWVGQYESSVMLHELGHAVHYLCTAQTLGCETVDNSDKNSETAKLSYKSVPRTKWQREFCNKARDGYFSLLDGNVTELGIWKQKYTVEEYLAEAFVAYITAPQQLEQKQPTAYSVYSLLSHGI